MPFCDWLISLSRMSVDSSVLWPVNPKVFIIFKFLFTYLIYFSNKLLYFYIFAVYPSVVVIILLVLKLSCPWPVGAPSREPSRPLHTTQKSENFLASWNDKVLRAHLVHFLPQTWNITPFSKWAWFLLVLHLSTGLWKFP